MLVRHVKRARQKSFELAPNWVRPAVRKAFYVLHPEASWETFKEKELTRQEFIDRFFDSEAELEAYEKEFMTGVIAENLKRAYDDLGNETFYDIHKDDCVRYYAYIRKYEPQTIVETGVFHGVSTLAILAALDRNDSGRLYSIDYSSLLDPTDEAELKRYERRRPSCSQRDSHLLPEGKEPGWVVPEELHDRWEFVAGRSQRKLPKLLSELGDVDMFVHDSEHSKTGMLFEFDLAWEHLSPGGMLFSHHVAWNDAFDTFVSERAPDADHGKTAVHYVHFDKHAEPGWGKYARKPDASSTVESAPSTAESASSTAEFASSTAEPAPEEEAYAVSDD
ncbi:class I SAM-dependent methyltransferase [Haloprofundus salilacus]|uniref:class I SAM-dependent methyltransferase n=1 Tax=Haloprofundus salilacus TaxID=2876190 RepID=UPI001CCF38D6|nr:class I SAM-dependent methyltransferase [Haloprofundus salilacus]